MLKFGGGCCVIPYQVDEITWINFKEDFEKEYLFVDVLYV